MLSRFFSSSVLILQAHSLLCDSSDALSRLASSILATIALHELVAGPSQAEPSALLAGFIGNVSSERMSPAMKRASLETLAFFVTGLGESVRLMLIF
jgi:hypothetical protein